MEKVFKNYKGIILFYSIIVLLAFICSYRFNSLAMVKAENETVEEVKYCA